MEVPPPPPPLLPLHIVVPRGVGGGYIKLKCLVFLLWSQSQRRRRRSRRRILHLYAVEVEEEGRAVEGHIYQIIVHLH